MQQSLDGVLSRVSEALRRVGDRYGYAHCLTVLCDNLREVRREHIKGRSKEVLDEFFSLYVFENDDA